MTVTADQFLDRLALKSRLRRWRFLAIAAVTLLCISFLNKGAIFTSAGRPFIAKISIDQMILEDADRSEILAELRDNAHVKAIVVRIDSPGGTVVGGEELYESLRDISSKKPVVAVMGGMATSGAYMAAIATDYIVARRGTITGSIGILLQTAEITELGEKLGVKFLTFKSGPLKAVPSPFEKLTPEAKQIIDASIRDSHEMFVKMVMERRKLSREKVLSLADGRIFTGQQALESRLIDALGGEKEALVWLQKEHKISTTLPVRKVELHEEAKGWKKIFTSLTFFFQKVALSAHFPLEGLMAIWHPN